MSIVIRMYPRNTGGNGDATIYAAPYDQNAWAELEAFIAMCKARSLDPAQEIINAIQRARDTMLAE